MSDKKELLVELGCEEIPARFVIGGCKELTKRLTEYLKSCGIGFDASGLKFAGTPRRIAVSVPDVEAGQPDRVDKRTGPAKKAAYDADGNPTKAAQGFARGLGISVDELTTIETDKGEYLYFEKSVLGRSTIDLLAEELPKLLEQMPWAKSMKWENRPARFVRPVHWVVAIFGGETIEFSAFGLESGNKTYGHRFLSPGPVEVTGFDDYVDGLRGSNVIPIIDERKKIISGDLERLGRELNGTVVEDLWLVDHVANLVEFPVALAGNFDERYLELPREVLVVSMRDHQKYFVVEDEPGKLKPNFITISNMLVPDPQVVIKGNERVLTARLEDARFYYQEDLKKPLDQLANGLSGVLYQKDLGTYAEKTDRVAALVEMLAEKLAPEAKENAVRAARLAKADLVSGVVGEFPELQGIMGMHYARAHNEHGNVADAIREHYLPKGLDSELPKTVEGALVALADKFDTICGCFGVGLGPTGKGDPFALRRAALGGIHILSDRDWSLPIFELVEKALSLVQEKVQAKDPKADIGALTRKIVEFSRGRLANYLKGEGLPTNIVDSVLSVRFADLAEVKRRAVAVAEFAGKDEFEPFAIAFKRAANIVADAKIDPATLKCDSSKFEDDAETALFGALKEVESVVAEQTGAADHLAALNTIATIRPQVDKFFDDVMVMHEDEALRNNRLALLARVGALFTEIADFKKI
jgi:glycyl-tRNA synthetase beta chain